MIMIYTSALPGQGPWPDINNSPGVTRIECPHFGPCISSNPNGIMAPPQAIPKLGQMENTPVQVSHLWYGGCHI